MKNIIRGLVFLVTFFISNNALAWGLTGHRVIAQIAEQHINKKTHKKISKIIGSQKLAYWANWSDFIKSDESWKHADSFHYINIPANLNREQFDEVLENSSDENAYKRVLFLINELKDNKNLTLQEKQHYLYFLIHIFGDVHQPLHIGRFEDLGGNKIKVDWFKSKMNIHTVWDSKLVDYENYSYTEYANLLDIETKQKCKKIQNGSYADWIYDSYTIANKIYSDVKMDDKLGYQYHYKYKYTVENQLLKGGLRLAKILNNIFS